ncbi:MAG: P-loop NTPase fold protein [Flavisolibacter sp.]
MAEASTSSFVSSDFSQFSISVRQNLRQLITSKYEGKASLYELVEELNKLHPEYGLEIFSKDTLIRFSDRKLLQVQSYDDWLLDVQNQVGPDVFSRNHVIHGRIFVIGLILGQFSPLDQVVQHADWWKSGFQALLNKMKEDISKGIKEFDLNKILTSEGQRNWNVIIETQVAGIEDVPNLDDMPTDEDLLSRDALAAYLARRIRHVFMPGSQRSIFIHVEGKWGTGKSTFLRFLKKHLTKKSEDYKANDSDAWVVAEFNAWQNQRLDPPWWFIIQSVYNAAHARMQQISWWRAFVFSFREKLWRLNTGKQFFVGALTTLVVFIVALANGINSEKGFNGTYIVGLISFLGFLWSSTAWIRTSMISGSAKSAREFVDTSGQDPMNAINNHYKEMIRRVKFPIAIFIDDLDRCNKEYGIKLLEGLQTIFKDVSVVYVVAADGKWLSTIYENNYSLFSSALSVPGKPFGMLFMDKTFQMVVELPQMSMMQKKQYWDALLGLNKKEREELLKKAEEEAERKLAAVENKGNKALLQQARSETNPLVSMKINEQALSKISLPQEDQFFESRLQKFLPIVETNPRSMKRLINDLSMQRAVRLLSNIDGISDDQLVLWTILKSQYPVICDYLLQRPESLRLDYQPKPVTSLLKGALMQSLLAFRMNGTTVLIDEHFLHQIKGAAN